MFTENLQGAGWWKIIMMIIVKTLAQPSVEGLDGHLPSREMALSPSSVARSERWEYSLMRDSLSGSEIRFVQRRSSVKDNQVLLEPQGPWKQRSKILAASSLVTDHRHCTPQRPPDKEWGHEQSHLQKEPQTHSRSESCQDSNASYLEAQLAAKQSG